MCLSADVNANVTLLGNYIHKNGTKYINLTDKRVNLSIGGSNMYFDNFFNGNQELSKFWILFFIIESIYFFSREHKQIYKSKLERHHQGIEPSFGGIYRFLGFPISSTCF